MSASPLAALLRRLLPLAHAAAPAPRVPWLMLCSYLYTQREAVVPDAAGGMDQRCQLFALAEGAALVPPERPYLAAPRTWHRKPLPRQGN